MNKIEKDKKEEVRYSLRDIQAVHLWEKIDVKKAERIVCRRLKRVILMKRIAWGSAAAVLFFSLWMVYPNNYPQPSNKTQLALNADQAVTTTNLPVLITAGGESITIAENITNNSNITLKEGNKIHINTFQQDTEAEKINTLIIPKGTDYSLMLSDGSQVWLKGGTVLKFPNKFPKEKRFVELEGEACFSVTKEKERRFMVKSGQMQLEVLGTTFNIAAFNDSEEIITTLVEGSVRQKFEGSPESVLLKPSEQTRYNKVSETVQTQVVNAEDVIAWTMGKSTFRNESLQNIIKEMSRVFDYQIECDNRELLSEHYHLVIYKNDDITAVLQKLSKVGGFSYEIKDKNIRIY